MKFYDRAEELQQLAHTREVAFSTASQMTVLTGRRRIGKTKLMLKSCEGTPTVYLFVSRSSEAALCGQFVQAIRESLGVFVPEGMTAFRDVFRFCMETGKHVAYNLVIDEFQEFLNVNPSVYSDMQDIWDRHKDTARVNLLLSGSVYSLMHRIFQDYREPLYGRATGILRLKPFPVAVLRQILSDYAPSFANDDLLALYAFTGGVPKYVELLMEQGAYTMRKMVGQMIRENSVFIEEGNVMLIQEFGKKFGNYYAILAAIASGINEPSRIAAAIGQTSLGGSLQRLEEDYDIIAKQRPYGAKDGTQTVRYIIKDHFLRFWFRYVVRQQTLVQSGRYDLLRELVMRDYPDYSGHELEDYFRDKLIQTLPLERIGSWWQASHGKNGSDQYEIDIVGKYFGEPRVLIAEVKRHRKNFNADRFRQKVDHIRTKLFPREEIETVCLTLEDM